jgi:integrating conjugative element protein (TIGR03759 family)
MLRLLTVLALFTTIPAIHAQDIGPLHEADSPSERLIVTKVSEEQLAQDWKLAPEEWMRFRQLMQGPLGTYSPNLDPLSALGIEARNNSEREHYADLQVEAEAARVKKLLDYQRAYDEAWARRVPDLLRVYLPTTNLPASTPPPQQSGRLAVFAKLECRRCEQRVKQLQASGVPFDLYLVGSREEDEVIRQWATRAGIEPGKVRDRRITLNHDSGRWQSLELLGELPAVVREINGKWIRQ